MAQTIKLRRSASQGAIPTVSQLSLGEIAINTHDGILYIKKDDGTESIVTLGSGSSDTAAELLTKIKTVDGTGTGLDADLLDGQQGSYYAAASHVHSYLPLSGGTLTGALTGTTGSFSGTVAAGTAASMYTSTDRGYFVAGTNDASNQHLYLGSYHGTTLKELTFSGSNNAFYPQTSASIDLGLASKKFKNLELSGTISSGAITSSGIIKSAMTGNAKLIAEGSTHANVEIDRGNTSSHNNLLFRTAGAAKWRIWQSGADNVLAVRNEVANTNVLTFTDSNSAFAGTISAPIFYDSNNTAYYVDPASTSNLEKINLSSGIIGAGITDQFTLNGKSQPHYGFNLSPTGGAPIGISGYYGISLATQGVERFTIKQNGNVGIGTDSPNNKLDVYGSGTGEGVFVRNSNNVHYRGYYMGAADNDNTVYAGVELHASSGQLRHYVGPSSYGGYQTFLTAGTERMRIDSAGRVGIGTSSPDTLLELVGADPILTIRDTETAGASTNATLRLAESGAADTLNDYWDINYTGGGALAFKTKYGATNAERMRIDSAGFVGIGTSSPSEKLHVKGLSEFLVDVNASDPAITFKSNLGNSWRAGNDSSTDAFVISQSESSLSSNVRLFIANGGNVGIGVTDPIYPLEIQGEAGIELYNGSGGGDVLNLRPSLGDANKYNMSISSYDHSGGGVGPADGLSINGFDGVSIATGSSTARQERMRIDSAGNLLVGTTNPLPGFSNTVEGVSVREGSHILASRSQGASGYFNRNTNDGELVSFRKDGATVGSIGAISNDLAIYSTTSGHNGLRLGLGAVLPTNNTGVVADNSADLGSSIYRFKDLYLSGTANVGPVISTVVNTGDATLLTLHHDTGADLAQQKSFIDFSFEDDNTNETPQVRIGAEVGQNANADSQIKEGSGAFVVYTNNADTTAGAAGTSLAERMRIDNVGNVGIGTSTPSRTLDVSKSVGSIIANFKNTGGTSSFITLGNTSSTADQIRVGSNGTAFTVSTNYAERMRIDIAGNVGIGTNSPMAKLHVDGAIVSEGGSFTSGIETATDASLIIQKNDYIYSDDNSYLRRIIGHASTGILEIGQGGTSLISDITLKPGSTGNIRFFGSGSEDVRINSSGNMGIGTTTPKAKLQVEEYGVDTTATSTAAITQVAIDSFPAVDFRSARYTIQVTNTTDGTYHLTELFMIHDGTTTNTSEFGSIFTGAAVEATFDADILSGNVRLLATPTSTDAMAFKVVRHSITV